jgi:hypothetical protein
MHCFRRLESAEVENVRLAVRKYISKATEMRVLESNRLLEFVFHPDRRLVVDAEGGSVDVLQVQAKEPVTHLTPGQIKRAYKPNVSLKNTAVVHASESTPARFTYNPRTMTVKYRYFYQAYCKNGWPVNFVAFDDPDKKKKKRLVPLPTPPKKPKKPKVVDVLCSACGNGDDEECLLLCDVCDVGTHTRCLQPPMDAVPSGPWFCGVCNAAALLGRITIDTCLERANMVVDDVMSENMVGRAIAFKWPFEGWVVATVKKWYCPLLLGIYNAEVKSYDGVRDQFLSPTMRVVGANMAEAPGAPFASWALLRAR